MEQILNYFQDARILVTGSSGYLATNLVSMLRHVKCTIIRLSRHTVQYPPIEGKAQILNVKGDIREPDIWEATLDKTDIVFHFSAQTSVYIAEQNPKADIENNVLPLIHLLETCKKNRLHPNVFFSGTVTQVGIPLNLPVSESHPDNPITIYDLHKLMAEKYLVHYINNNIIQGAALRLANVYGPGPKSSSSERGVLNTMIKKALYGENLTIYGDGNYIRDYIYIEDAVRAFIYAAACIEQTNGKYFVIGSGEKCTIHDAFHLISQRILNRINRHVPVIHIDMPTSLSSIETRNFVADMKGFHLATNWSPKYHLSEGIDRTIDFYLTLS